MIDNFDKTKAKKRCAIYTRKSSEEGLEQEFNSLDAQRLSAENYILSQSHEGWILVNDHYDDGGYSGGTLERPALKRLFNDIKAGKIDCIIVYKIDRLTRSLADFSEIIKILDEYNVSFVAVTQSFNTANSMGRLMLNVLLSFAQYERELTGERIRDKFDASCKKGMWMGGCIPIGYDLKDRRLTINEDEAKIIRILFNTFIENGSVTETYRELNDLGFKTKTWIASSGKIHKGKNFNKCNVRNILNNELYIGKINHKGNIYDGLHNAIISDEVWQKAQKLLKSKVVIVSMPKSRISQAPLLKGIMNCGICGNKMTPTYTSKNGRKYRYYICQAKMKGNNDECQVGRIPAKETEELVINQVLNILQKPEIISQTVKNKDGDVSQNQIIKSFQKINQVWDELFVTEQARIINLLVRDVIVRPEGININIYKQGLGSLNNEIFG
jgi:site-specific DNA recombinase